MPFENISFFVSSTFNDMHHERDALHLEVMPRILPAAEKGQCSVQLFDLRWGVDTSNLSEKESSEKVLRVCLDGIDKCHPFMIIILGDRYGWIPDSANIADAMTEHGISGEFFHKSVTELEIQYGLLLNSTTDCYIYLREIDYSLLDPSLAPIYRDTDPTHVEKLRQLKERLRKAYPDKVRTYKPEIDPASGRMIGSGNFADLVTADITRVLSLNENPVQTDWQERERRSVERQMNAEGKGLVYRDYQVRRILRARKESPIVVLRGEPGSGKTSLFSQLLPELREDGTLVIPFLCGNSPFSSDVAVMLRYFAYALEDALGTEHALTPGNRNQSETERWQGRLTELCRKCRKPVLFLIDAYDQLPESDETARMTWAPEGPGTLWRCILSAQPDTGILREHTDIRLDMLTEEERIGILNSQFRKHGKALDSSVIQHILKQPGSANPLYLRLVLARLLMLYRTDFEQINRDAAKFGGAMASINQYLIQMISSLPDHVDELAALILRHAGELAADTVKGDRKALAAALELLAVSRCGLRLCDLEAAVERTGGKWNALQFEWMRYFLDFCFTEQADGRINFSHKSLRAGVLKAGKVDEPACHGIIARTLAESNSDTAAGDAFYHLFRCDGAGASIAETLFMRAPDHTNNLLSALFKRAMYELADRDEGRAFTDIFKKLSPTGKWYASVMLAQFADDIPESPRRRRMLMDTSQLCRDFLKSAPRMDELLQFTGPDASAGRYLRYWEDDSGLELENGMRRTQLAVIAADASEPLQGAEAALRLYREAAEEADRAYALRLSEKRLHIAAASQAVYIAYIKMADICQRLHREREGVEVCLRGIKTLNSLSSQALYSGEDFEAPVDVLQSLAGRMMQELSGTDSAKAGDLLEHAYNYADMNYRARASDESLNALFYAETSYAEFLTGTGEKRKALELFSNALKHIDTLCSRDYSLQSLLNKCAIELKISDLFAEEDGNKSAYYAEAAEKTAREGIRLAPEDPRPRILLAAAKTNRSALLLTNSLSMQAADMLYELLDELEPWLEAPCDSMFTVKKAEIMRNCGSLLKILDEPDTAALCREYEKRFS